MSTPRHRRKFDNSVLRKFYYEHDIVLRLSCPYTSQQNGKAERVLRTLNKGVRALLFHAALPQIFWVEALQTSTYLHNQKPCKPRVTPYSLLYHTDPDYKSLRVFGCLCYPNTESTSPNKLSHRSVACIFIGHPQDHRGYRCYSLSTRKVIISRHVHFDEAIFPTDPDQHQPHEQAAPTTHDTLITATTTCHLCPRHRRAHQPRRDHRVHQPRRLVPVDPTPRHDLHRLQQQTRTRSQAHLLRQTRPPL